MKRAMVLSFVVGILMLFLKGYAYYLTRSAAIFSDAAESVIHIFAVGFATYSMWLSLKPADENHPYGHEKINFFSAGFEGALIMIAAGYIIFESLQKLLFGVQIENVDEGLAFIVGAAALNLFLGLYLVSRGKRFDSLILKANGKHILTDCLTSFGVILALILVRWTGISLFDPLLALLIAANILWTGSALFKQSISGLMDQVDPKLHRKILEILEEELRAKGLGYHRLRHRQAGQRVFIEFDLLFDGTMTLEEAHEHACVIEATLHQKLKMPLEIMTHLEPKETHDLVHHKYGLQ